MTLENLLRMTVSAKDEDGNNINITPYFRVAVQYIKGEGVYFIIHPDGCSGEKLDFLVKGNVLRPM